MKLSFVGAALLISVLSADAQHYIPDLPPPWPFRNFGSAENPGFRDDVLFGNSIPQTPLSGLFGRFGSTWPFRRSGSEWPFRRSGSEWPFRRFGSEENLGFRDETHILKSIVRHSLLKLLRPFGLAGNLGFRDDSYVGKTIPQFPPSWPFRRSGSEWPFRRSGSEWPFRRSGSEWPFRRSGSEWPFRRSGSEWPFRRFGSEENLGFRDDAYMLKSILRHSLLKLLRPLGLAGNPGYGGDASFRNSIPQRLPFWFPRSFGSAWPFRHFGSGDRFRSEKLIHMLDKLIDICKAIFDQERRWEPRRNPMKINPTFKISCGNPMNLHCQPYLPTNGYLGFPQGFPFYPQGYREVGIAQQSLPVATQPFVPVIPQYYPPPSIYPGIASSDYPSTQQSNYWNPPNPVMNSYPTLVPPEPLPAQPLPPAQPQTGYVPSVLYSPQNSAGAALSPPPQYVPPPLSQRAPSAFAYRARPAPPPRSLPGPPPRSLPAPPPRSFPAPPPRSLPAPPPRSFPAPPPRSFPAPPPRSFPAPPPRARPAFTRVYPALTRVPAASVSSVVQSPDTPALPPSEDPESDASERPGIFDKKTSALKGPTSQKSPRNKPQTTEEITELDI
ncbi:histone acetyltransferase p300-like isoform X19 [Pantherophis guttatus]|uniref:Histone acetyltransferase p300-like isoform X15 n=1 Tax=Pantherophis guttatus TaxID=94885 RepID=A0ABM3ZND6_PANGU|nr:histone acetyltransferase p300-like isoform X15 [Pantherophis guttatus]XP_060549889.1 histone acetyltransferase p300-like isoform X19 [Pantherophis guttatus]